LTTVVRKDETDSQRITISTGSRRRRRRQEAAVKKNRRSAHGYNESDPLKVHLQRFVAELAISLITGQPLACVFGTLNDAATKPPDVGANLQVRSTEYATGHLIVHPGDSAKDLFILVIVRGRNLTLKGWLPGCEAQEPKYWGDKFSNGRPAFFVPQGDLRPCEALVEQFPGAPFVAIALSRSATLRDSTQRRF
jgi:hypothetical protein